MELAEFEEMYHYSRITPYEKNIEMWRQLWRVVEKSDILVQIVDGRDPLFYRCDDFSSYVKEVDSQKMNLLLINKADLISEEVRKRWSEWFTSQGIDHVFFSAKQEQKVIDSAPDEVQKEDTEEIKEGGVKQEQGAKTEEEKEEVKDEITPSQMKNTWNIVKTDNLKELLKKEVQMFRQMRKVNINDPILEEEQEDEEQSNEPDQNPEETQTSQQQQETGQEVDEEAAEYTEQESTTAPTDLNSRVDKLEGQRLIQELRRRKLEENPDLVTIGMVGFPNVGKSSVINVLCGKKLVGVAARPGKTRNFQTIFLEKNLLLCDCPGLVFPSIAGTKAQMVCNGVFPIDNLKEYMDPIKLIAAKIPRRVFEYVLKFNSSSKKTFIDAGRLLHAYATSRGYMMAGSGLPNYHQASREILKKLVNGEIIFCRLPPSSNSNGKNETQYIKEQFNDVPEKFEPHQVVLVNEKDNKGKIYKSVEHQDKELEAGFFEDEVDEEDLFDVYELDQEDIINLVRGQRVKGVKLGKDQRRDLKWSIKRDADGETLLQMLDVFINGKKSKLIHVKRREAEKAIKR